jgi:hypothetical protein
VTTTCRLTRIGYSFAAAHHNYLTVHKIVHLDSSGVIFAIDGFNYIFSETDIAHNFFLQI